MMYMLEVSGAEMKEHGQQGCEISHRAETSRERQGVRVFSIGES
jgi:hypothetical protein